MRKYPDENWKHLGDWLHDMRMQRGHEFRNMDTYAKIVGRSTRQLRGLERGETVGQETLEAVAKALGIDAWYVFAVLQDPQASDEFPDSVRAEFMKIDYEVETGHRATPSRPAEKAKLSDFSDEELLAELTFRVKRMQAALAERFELKVETEEGGPGWSATGGSEDSNQPTGNRDPAGGGVIDLDRGRFGTRKAARRQGRSPGKQDHDDAFKDDTDLPPEPEET